MTIDSVKMHHFVKRFLMCFQTRGRAEFTIASLYNTDARSLQVKLLSTSNNCSQKRFHGAQGKYLI